MKIGVFLGNIDPASGGGFTFQDEVFRAFLKLESLHTFVVFSHLSNEQSKELATDRIQFVSLPQGFLCQAMDKLSRVISYKIQEFPLLQRRLRIAHWFQRIVDNLGIDLMWFLGPSHIEIDIPYIITVWDLQHRLQPWFPEVSTKGAWRMREKMFDNIIPRASAIITGTEAGREEIVRFYRVPLENVKLVPHPTPSFALNATDDICADVISKYQLPERYLFYPAQFWSHKNHVGLLSAVKLLREQYGLVFHVVFSGSDRGNLEFVRKKTEEFGLTKYVHFLGFVPLEDLKDMYRNAFALVYLTFFGPENLPPLEAFALGCPVIASNVPGAQEQLGNAAILVEPKDEVQIAEKIKLLLEDPDLRQTLVSRGLARASSWTSEDFVKRVISLIDDFEPIRRCWD